MKHIQIHPLSALFGACAVGLALTLTGMAQQSSDPSALPAGQGIKPPPPEWKELLSHISIVYLDDGQGGLAKTIRFSGVNVQVVNGLGATNGNAALPASVDPIETSTNGVGNLILGYNESVGSANRTGSHNLVVGSGQEFSSFGGILGGYDNVVTGPYSSVGGYQNEVRGQYCAISGGQINLIDARVTRATIHGGVFNRILPYNYFTAESSTICGGNQNLIHGAGASSILGGYNNSCEFVGSSVVVGGSSNIARATSSVLVGGSGNIVSENTGSGYDGQGSVVVGGSQNRAEGADTVIVGGTSNYIDRYASTSVIEGGRSNNIIGSTATNCVVGGGFDRQANSADDWRAGDLFQDQ